jgi:hypothetical protein
MASKPILLQPNFRSGLEEKLAAQLDAEGRPYDYESEWVRFVVPAFNAKYLPDFPIRGTNILIEGKGRFGGHKSDADGAQARQRMILMKEQNPHLDVRIVFEKANLKIYKGSKTTYAKWATDHGFKWADKGVIPASWIEDIKAQLKNRK